MRSRLSPWTLFVVMWSLLLALPAQGDGKLTLQASFEPATAKPGDEVTLLLAATVDPAYHAYGSKETTNLPVALDGKRLQTGGLELVGPAKVPPGKLKKVFGMDSWPLPPQFTVKQVLKVPAGAKAGEVVVTGELAYQVCDENHCLAPSAVAFAAKLGVAAAAGTAPLGPLVSADGKFTIAARCEPATAKPGDTVRLVLACSTDLRYHAYGSKETTNVPIALDPAKVVATGLRPSGAPRIPPGERTVVLGQDTFPLPHEFEVSLDCVVEAAAVPGAVLVKGELDYQLCDENSCDMPASAPFQAALTVVAAPADAAAPAPAPGPSSAMPTTTKPGLQLVPDAKFEVEAKFATPTVRAGETARLVLECTILDPLYHAYGKRETVGIPPSLPAAKQKWGTLVPVGGIGLPDGEPKDKFGTKEFILEGAFQVTQELRVPAEATPGELVVEGELDYMLCDENSCDPLASAPFRAVLRIEAGAARAAVASPSTSPPVAKPASDGFGGSWWALILACIGGGLFALAMPCTYPMIPITFSFFTKQAEKRGGKVMPLALTYGFGIVLMFTLVGALMATVIVDVVNHWVTNAVIGVMFLFFAFVLFGWINLNPPQSLQQFAGKASRSGGYLGVFFMGATLVITSFTCTAPIVGSLLANVAQYGTGRVAFGMAVFGLTMAAPFVVLALMPTKVKAMPRSGEWMETLKVSLGFVELAAALKFVSMVDFAMGWQVLPRELFLMLWTAIFGLWALYLFGILRKAGAANDGVGAGRMAAGMFVTLLTAYFFFGALGNKLDFYTTNFVPGYSAEMVAARHGGDGGDASGKGHVLAKHTVVSDDEPRALEVAKAEDKLMLYNFTGFN